VGTFDPLHGGFGQAPKYPLVGSLRVVLQALHETQGPDFQQVFLKTLDAIGDRGLFDPVDGGWYHYSTNDLWTLPRFEKLTEDNAGLIKLFLDASLVTGRKKYLERAALAVGWARSTLLDPERGVFGGSQFADEEYFTARPEVRAQRPTPAVDRTVYTNASAAMASAFLRAAQVEGAPDLAETALRGLDWLFRECVTSDGVAHLHDGRPALPVLLRDAAALASAAIDAYDHTGEKRWLDHAVALVEEIPRRFWTEAQRALADRAVDALERGELAKLRVNLHENASVAESFARLFRIAGRDDHRQWAEKLLLAFPDFYDGYGHQTAEYAIAADWIVRPPEKVAGAALEAYWPRRVVER
jgi:uncharacterized protein YyaL (SSP411 family)